MIDQNITISNWWLFGAADLSVSRSRLCVVFEYLPKTIEKNEHFMWFRNSHGLKSSDIFSVCFSIRPLSSSHLIITHTQSSCVSVSQSLSLCCIHLNFCFMIKHILFQIGSSHLILLVLLLVFLIVIVWFYYQERERKKRAREKHTTWRRKKIYIEININKIQ